MAIRIPVAVAVAGALLLMSCGVNPRASSVSMNNDALMTTWRCDDPDVIRAISKPGPDGVVPTIGEKLLQCPFNRDLQIAAMAPSTENPVSPEVLAEIVEKTRWGIDYQYRKYEQYLLDDPEQPPLVPWLVDRLVPGSVGVYNFGKSQIDKPVSVGMAAPVIIKQMQQDRELTGDALSKRLARLKTGRGKYPLWKTMVDLEAYFYAGTAQSAVAGLDTAVAPHNILPGAN